MTLAWLTLALAVECKEPIPLDELSRSLDVAEQAYIDFDDTGFRDQVNILTGVHLPCVGDPVDRRRPYRADERVTATRRPDAAARAAAPCGSSP